MSSKEDDDNEQETSEMQFEDFALKTNVLAFASRSKAEARPQIRTPACSSTRTEPIGERSRTDIEPENYSSIAYPVSKQLSTLLRRGHLPREEDGAIEFWRLKYYLRNEFVHSQHWSDEMWKSTMARGGGNKKRFQYCTDSSGQEILYLRALQGHLGRNPIDPELQDNVLIPNNFFEYIYHIRCAINVHSITNSGLILGGQKFGQKTDGILYVCGSCEQRTQRSQKHWPGSTASCMVQAENVEKTPRHGVLGRHKNLLKRKDLSSIKHDRTQSSFTTHSQHIVSRRLLWWKLEKSYTRKYMRHLALLQRFPFKTIGWKNWVQKLLEEVKTPNKPNQKIKNPIVSTLRPVKSCVPVSG